MEMTPRAARMLAGLLEKSTGQQLVAGRHWLIGTALQPVMRRHGIGTLDMLAGMSMHPDADALRAQVVEALLNHETSFFRDFKQFGSVGEDALPALAERRGAARRLRIWSAGCSTGQEAYSVALQVARNARWRDWTIEILGTDFSATAIAQAREGLYSQFEVQRGMPIAVLLSEFDAEDEAWRVKPALRAIPRFMVHNLLDPPPAGRFDVILCRNVLLYFSAEGQRAVLDRLAAAIAPDGLLMLGAGETLLGLTDAFQPDPVLRGFYRRAAAAS